MTSREILPHQVEIGDRVNMLGVLFEVTDCVTTDTEVWIWARLDTMQMRVSAIVPRSSFLRVMTREAA